MSKKGTRKGFIASDGAPSNAVASDEDVIDAVVTDDAFSSNVARDEAWNRLGIAQEPNPIRLNGQRVVSIGALPVAAPEPEFERQIDWKTLARSLGFTGQETRVLILHWVENVPASRLHIRLGISAHHAAKLYATVRARLGISRPTIAGCLSVEPIHDSRRPAFRDRLPSGRRPWSLARLDESFREVMQKENYFSLISQRDPREFQKSAKICAGSIGAIVNPNEVLENQLRAERLRFDRIAIRGGEIRDQVDKSETTLAGLRAELKVDVEESLLNERIPDEKLRKRVFAAETELARLRELSAAHAGAVARQRDVIQAIENEIAATARARMLERVGPKFAQFDALVDEMVALAFDASQDMQGFFLAPTELLPESRDLTESGLRLQVFYSVLKIRQHLVQSYENSGFDVKRTA